MTELVRVLLKQDNEAIIHKWPKGKKKVQHLSAEQMQQMGSDREATWLATEAGDIWWLKERARVEA